MLQEFKERLRYMIDRAFAREFAGQFILFLVLVVVVTLVGMTAYFFGLFGPENEDVPGIPRGIDRGFLDSLWWSMQRVLRLPGFERMYGATPPILAYALFLSIMGLAVFGILVSMINTAMQRRIETLRKGDSPVKERGHVLVLGWSDKIYSVLRQLARLQPGSKVVILAPEEIEEMQEALRINGSMREDLTIILRSGIPSNVEELNRVAVDRASSVILVSPRADRDRLGGDSEVIKTMMLLAAWREWRGRGPTLTAEIALEQNQELAEIAARGRMHLISSSTVISKILVQCIRNPGLADVYSELFAPYGNGLHVQSIAACSEQTMRDISYGFPDAIPIGIAWEEQQGEELKHASGLNPEPDYDIAEDEQLILLAHGVPVKFSQPGSAYTSQIYREGNVSARVPRRVLLIGWNGNVFDILVELDAHALRGTEIVLLSEMEPEAARKHVEQLLDRELENVTVEYLAGDPVERGSYSEIDLTSFQTIVLLADTSSGEPDIDARTLRTLLRLSDLRRRTAASPHTVVELLDIANKDLLAGLHVDDVVVSDQVISAQLAQIAKQPVLGPIYRELLSAGGVEISLRPVGDYVDIGSSCSFFDLAFAAQQKMEIALGVRLAREGELFLNPERELAWRLDEDDRVVVLAQQLYR
jgi:voltage-gated potassium channel Kch